MALKLHLGCGLFALDGWVNVDTAPLGTVDQQADLDQPWPWADDSVSEIRCHHVFEHVERPVEFMAEAWRVLEPGGLLDIVVPHWQHRNAYTDPTHRRYCTEDTFRYWVPGTWLYDLGLAWHQHRVRFSEERNRVDDGTLAVLLRKVAEGEP